MKDLLGITFIVECDFTRVTFISYAFMFLMPNEHESNWHCFGKGVYQDPGNPLPTYFRRDPGSPFLWRFHACSVPHSLPKFSMGKLTHKAEN